MKGFVGLGAIVSAALSAGGALAQAYGHAEPGQLGFQAPVTEVARDIMWLHDVLLVPIIIAISLFVLALLAYAVFAFDEKRNPTPSKTTHNSFLEVAWTVIPILVLVVIAIPSFRLLTKELVVPAPDVTIKVTGSQWHWSYNYSKDNTAFHNADEVGAFGFDSIMKEDQDLKPAEGDIHLLSVDNEAVVPINKVVHLQVTAVDVIHSFVVQSFGVRADAVPGRMNETWFKAEREGMYYGQCSKICGKDHAYMPIAFRVVSEEKYKAWLVDSQKKYAAAPSNVELAATERPTR